MKNSEQLGLRG